jgi:hypothetical protein
LKKMMSKKTEGVGLLTLALSVIALFPTAIMVQAQAEVQTQAQVKILAGQNQNAPFWTLTIDFRPKHMTLKTYLDVVAYGPHNTHEGAWFGGMAGAGAQLVLDKDQYPAGYYYRIDIKTAHGNGNNGLYKAKTSKLQYHFLEMSTGKDQAYVWTRGSESLHAVPPPPPPDVLEEGANGTEQLYNQHPLIYSLQPHWHLVCCYYHFHF